MQVSALMKPQATPPTEPVATLNLATDTGAWTVRSSSATVYLLDLDRRRMMRMRGPGSGRFDFDDEWVPLVGVTSIDPSDGTVTEGRVRVGHRPRYLTDPLGGHHDNHWRMQRTVTAIEPLESLQGLKGVPAGDRTHLRGHADVRGHRHTR
ncbi:hypothetical protein ICW40_05670 [Actinotalea ferrariae]|uniref:hypothetical protein n=1 Tax=Actinotalea ferrariae TaxID=1386098 RepID=UPI001C8BC71F|nr:hypothetical protein [Actinotalea ferrariae]MBX9244294.1 hypothetical protein [Actinotalea ferrariae]